MRLAQRHRLLSGTACQHTELELECDTLTWESAARPPLATQPRLSGQGISGLVRKLLGNFRPIRKLFRWTPTPVKFTILVEFKDPHIEKLLFARNGRAPAMRT